MNSVEVVKNGDVLNINNQPVTSNNHQDEDKTNGASKSGWKKQPKHWKFKIICLYANFMTLVCLTEEIYTSHFYRNKAYVHPKEYYEFKVPKRLKFGLNSVILP